MSTVFYVLLAIALTAAVMILPSCRHEKHNPSEPKAAEKKIYRITLVRDSTKLDSKIGR